MKRFTRLPLPAAIAAAIATASAIAPDGLRAVPVPHLKLLRSVPAADTTLAAAPARRSMAG